MSGFQTLDDMRASGQRVLVRVDFNVPMRDGAVSDDTRLRAALPTIQGLIGKGAKVILMAHFGRPKGERVPEMSLRPVAPALQKLLGKPVAFSDFEGDAPSEAISAMQAGDVLLLENLRYHPGEEKNDADFAKHLASLGDAYVNDAFSAAHRAHASTDGVAQLLPAYAGRAMQAELEHLQAALGDPVRPVVGVVGGAKVSSKIDLLNNLVKRLDHLVIGGGMANTFLYAQGYDVGASLCEMDLKDTALQILEAAKQAGCQVHLPQDVVVAQEFKAHAEHSTKTLSQVSGQEMILDAGPKTVAAFEALVKTAKTLVWNGPLGAFELTPFDTATVAAAKAAAQATLDGDLVSVAGGGDTVAALNHAGVAGQFSFVSTAGGAFLEWMEGKALPGVEALKVKETA